MVVSHRHQAIDDEDLTNLAHGVCRNSVRKFRANNRNIQLTNPRAGVASMGSGSVHSAVTSVEALHRMKARHPTIQSALDHPGTLISPIPGASTPGS